MLTVIVLARSLTSFSFCFPLSFVDSRNNARLECCHWGRATIWPGSSDGEASATTTLIYRNCWSDTKKPPSRCSIGMRMPSHPLAHPFISLFPLSVRVGGASSRRSGACLYRAKSSCLTSPSPPLRIPSSITWARFCSRTSTRSSSHPQSQSSPPSFLSFVFFPLTISFS